MSLWTYFSSKMSCFFICVLVSLGHSKKYATQMRSDKGWDFQEAGLQEAAAAAMRFAAYRCG